MSQTASLRIHVEQLENGGSLEIKETLPASLFMEVEDEELSFPGNVEVEGKAYLADSHVVVHFSLKCQAKLLCTVCNEPFTLPIEISNAYITRDAEELNGGVYPYGEDIKEEILLKIPAYAQCKEEGCPQRNVVSPFLKLPSAKADEVYYPFKDLS